MLYAIAVVVVGGVLIFAVVDPIIGFEPEEGTPYLIHQVFTMMVGAAMAGVFAKRG